MSKYIGLVDVGLSAGGGEYYSSIDDIFLGTVEMDNEDDALEFFNQRWNRNAIENLGDWVYGSYYIKVLEV